MHALIIDDDNISIFLIKQALRRAGVFENVSSFLSAETALSFLKEAISSIDTPDIILLDLNMPVMNGWEFLKALQPYAQQLIGRCHVYILTSSLALLDTGKFNEYELVAGFIHKPLDQVAIQTIVSQMSDQKQYKTK